ncbi:ABC transporter permease [Agromyces aurantiacus]|uniref:Transport permease protein n=1 Tax=Agromyces aurantiacus TaxID=165814 RepID=A0ABV9R7K5_9MICO|nr:ABC transporter permease [Agromyces aurantiacus]MBM7504147.1 ABC-2 type transport system permease protein [Agromyces aurantiacus]
MEAESLTRAQRIALEPLEPVDRRVGPFRGFARSVGEIWDNRYLLVLLVRRELKARYKNSSLGVVWSLFRPLVQLLIYYFAIGQILGAARFIPDFAIFVFIGLTTWGLFSEIVSGSTTSLIVNGGLVKKVYLPREIFPLSAVGSALFNFAVQLLVLLVAIGLLSTFPADSRLLLAPLAILTLIVFSVAVGLVLSAWNVYLRDTEHLVDIALVILFWLSPIVYSYTFVQSTLGGSWLQELYLANPVTISIIAMQKALWNAGSTATGDLAQAWPPDLELRLAIMLLVSLVLLWFAQRLFARVQGNFAQEL